MDNAEISRLLNAQAGVVSRRQVLAAGADDNEIETRVRRREWARVHEGVYVDHTGPLTWEQRAWAAVLFAWPAALGGAAALRAHRTSMPSRCGDRDPIEVVIRGNRRVRSPEGVVVRRVDDYDSAVQANRKPPRVRIEHALLVLSSRAGSEDAAVAILADGCQSHATTARRLLARLDRMPRLRGRRLLVQILRDVSAGAFSALERRYLAQVERAHGLPAGCRQKRIDNRAGITYRDVEYAEQRVVVELDGRLGHEWNADRWDDLDRDMAAAEEDRLALRLGWKQVLDPCRLAVALARILQARGWRAWPRSCSSGCPAGQSPNDGSSPAPGAGELPSMRVAGTISPCAS